MSGKVLLDAAFIFKASRGVLLRHIALRRRQFNLYNKTSSLTKLLRSQTGRVTLTVNERFKSPGQQFSTQTVQEKTSKKGSPETGQHNIDEKEKPYENIAGLEQDHFYEKSERNSTSQPPPDESLSLNQSKAQQHPMPDGSISPVEIGKEPMGHGEDTFSDVSQENSQSHPVSDQKNRVDNDLLPESISGISTPHPVESKESSAANQTFELQDEQVQFDSAYSPSTQSPKAQASTSMENNVESFTNVPKDQRKWVPEVQAIPQQGQPSEAMYSEIFHSPRVAKLIRQGANEIDAGKDLHLHGIQDTPTEKRKSPDEEDQDSYNVRFSNGRTPETIDSPVTTKGADLPGKNETEELHTLAENIVIDAAGVSSAISEVGLRIQSLIRNLLMS